MDFAVAWKSLDRKYLQKRSKLLVSIVKNGTGGGNWWNRFWAGCHGSLLEMSLSPLGIAEAAFIHLCAPLVTGDQISQTGNQLHFCAGPFLSPLSGKTNKLFTQCFLRIIAKNQDHTSSAFRSFILPVQTCLCETLSVLFFCAVSLLCPC